MSFITEQIEKYTAEHSGFEISRNYVSLSNIYKEEYELIADYYDGYSAGHMARLKCYKGYQMEADLKSRILKTFGPDVITLDHEISIHDGLIKGHPDFLYNGFPADIKSVLLDEHLPTDRIPKKPFWQINAYAKYMGVDRGLIIYESRESGKIFDKWVYVSAPIAAAIDVKVKNIYNRICGNTQ